MSGLETTDLAQSDDLDDSTEVADVADFGMVAPFVLQAVGGTSVVVVAVVVLLIVLLVWVWMRGGEAAQQQEARKQIEEGEKPSSDILDQREEVDEEVEVDEEMSLAEVKKAKMAKVREKDKERRKAGAATEEARKEHEGEPVEAPDEQPSEEGEPDEPQPDAETDETTPTPDQPADEAPVEDEQPDREEVDDEPAEGASDDEESADPETVDEASVEQDGETTDETDVPEPDSSGLGIPDPSDAGIVDESEVEETDEEEGRERKGSGISVPTPDDVSQEDIGTTPDADTGEEAGERADDDSDEPEEDSDEQQREQTEPEANEQPEAEDEREASQEESEEDRAEQQKVEAEEVKDEEVEEAEAEEEEARDAADREDEQADEALEDDEPKSLEKGLEKTREGLIDQLSALFTGESIDEEIVEEVEEVLIKADVGPKVTRKVLDAIGEQLEGEEKNDPSKVWGFIRQYTRELLEAHEAPLAIDDDKPFVILVVGVNGVGKTTSIGKMASKFKKQGKSVLLVAGDTFRAAAVDQLGIWAERTGLPMHTGEEGADPASVIYDGIERGIDEDIDVVICDTSGRLHTDKNLMEELKKMERVAGNAKEGAPHEVNLVLDANTGQNALAQAEKFFEALDVSGITLTKFDGTARGGVILGVCDRFDAPVRYVGIGERVVDLREFDADEFVEALFM